MTKMIKMSLVAAVAVAGMTNVASAADVSYKGKVYVEGIYKTQKDEGSDEQGMSQYDIDFDLTATAKLDDNFAAVLTFEADSATTDADVSDKEVALKQIYFTYANSGLASKFGRQAISSPFTDGERAEGLLASYTMGNLTAVGASFANSSLFSSDDISILTLLGSAGPVNFQAWQFNVAGNTDNTTVVLGGKVGPVHAEVRQSTTSYDDSTTEDGSTMKAIISGKASNIGLTATYLTTDEDGASYVSDSASANTYEQVVFTAKDKADATLTAVAASVPLMDGYSATVQYGTMDYNENDDASEYVLKLTKKFSKSLTGTVRYADYTQTENNEDTDETHARVDLKYTF